MTTRKAISYILKDLFIASVGLAMLSGCLNERIVEAPSTPLRFEVNAPWNTVSKTKGTPKEATETAEVTVHPLKNNAGEEVLYLLSEKADFSSSSLTRATPIGSTEDFYDAFGAFAFIYPSSDTWASAGSSLSPNYMYNVRVTESSGWTTSYFWPGSAYKVKFFAYAPYNGSGISLSSASSIGAPTLSYEVPSSVNAQKDILIASPDECSGNTNTAKALTFYHALTAVKFTSDEMLPGTISGISINGIYSKGTHTFGDSSWIPETSAIGNFSQTLSVTVDGSDGQTVTTGAQTFILLPQTLPSGAEIVIDYKDNLTGTERTLTADIAGQTWSLGKTIVYKISTSGISITSTLEVSAPSDFSYSGGTNTYTVASYATVAQTGAASTTLPVAWTAQFSTDGGSSWNDSAPEWLTTFTTSGSGGENAESYDATITAQTAMDHTAYLRAEAAVSGYDLSTKGGTTPINTANCYIVSAPGSYRLPLVYGNAIKNGETNSSAYTTTATGSVLSTFINHLGNTITDPYIYNNTSCTPVSAKLVWQDAQNIISNVSLSGTTHLNFDVSAENIVPGNAVVAVCDGNGDIMWSWHIWITDYDLGEDLKTVGSYSFLPYNIGWVDDATVYEERSVKVRFTQTGTGTQKIIEVKQNANYVNAYYFRNLYFQWGRKDPMMSGYVRYEYSGFPLNQWITTNKVRTWYDENGTSYSNWNSQYFGTGTNEIASCIKQPHYFNYNFYSYDYTNLWATDNSSTDSEITTTIKTIYDPSPVGYKVPTIVALQAISADRSWDGTRKGFIFSCNNGETSFFPATGETIISSDGYTYEISSGVTDTYTYGYYWSSLPAPIKESNTYGYSLIFDNYSYSTMFTSHQKVYGQSVRPVAE